MHHRRSAAPNPDLSLGCGSHMDAFCAPAADAPEIDAVSSYVHGGGTPDGTPYKSGIAEAEIAEWTAWEKAGSANPFLPSRLLNPRAGERLMALVGCREGDSDCERWLGSAAAA